jgi:uncharacterized protein
MEKGVPGMQAVGPVQSSERISSLDMVRGFALLGILLMNIVGFGLFAAYDNPTNSGGSTGIDLWVWITMHILAEGKMRCLFSMVFGAGVVLLTGRAEERGGSSADVYYRRNLWLLLFGILHAYLLWHGEVLYPYALCALALYPFRRVEAKRLIAIAGSMMIVMAAMSVFNGYETGKTIEKGNAAVVAEKTGAKLSDEQREAKEKWEQMRKHAQPTPEEVEKVNRKWRGSIIDVLKIRAEEVYRWHSLPYFHYMNLDLFSMMFLGMGLFKLGVFSAERTFRFYTATMLAGYAIGLTLNSYTAYVRVSNHFDLVVNAYSGITYDLGRLSIALAHVSVMMLLFKSGRLLWLLQPLAAIGQTALSNYLLQSLICSTIFCGYGFAMFGRMQRHQLYYVVAGIWVFQMIVSPIWLRHFHFGPAEWVWRSLTYWKKQPMRKAAPVPDAATAPA